MDRKSKARSILELNLAMLFISTSGVLGRYIELPVPITIFYRALFAALALLLFIKVKKIELYIASGDRFIIFISGILMGMHWVTYFYALKLSNVAIGMLSIFTYPVLTAFLEPLILKTGFQRIHVFLAALVLAGIYFLVPDLTFENTYTQAVLLGVLSALCYALRNILMKNKVKNYHGSLLMWIQLVITAVFLFPFLWFLESSNITTQWPCVLLLAILTTAIGHTLFLLSFKRFSITTASIISSVQPIYGIIIGIVLLKEIPSWGTLIGGSLIIISVVIESLRIVKR